MKIKKMAIASLIALVMSSCMTISTGYGPHGSEEDIKAVVTEKKNITFSVEYTFDEGGANGYEENVIKAIREQFYESGMFGRVDYVLKKNASPYHYHFRVESTGRIDYKLLAILASICSYTLCPTWMDTDLNWTMSYVVRGKETHRFTSQQTQRTITWMPCVILMPFMNTYTTGQGVFKKPVQYFLSEIKNKNLNSIK